MSQQGQNQGISFDQMKQLLSDQRANRSYMQRHPVAGSAMGMGAAGLAGLGSGLFGGGGLFGKKEQTNQVPLFSPQIMALKNMMAPQLWEQLMGDKFDFGPIEELTRRNFAKKTAPGIMNRFNMGNNLNSGAQMSALGEAGAGLDSQLAAMRQGYGQQRQQLLASLMGPALTPSFENVARPRQQGGMEQGFQAIMAMLPYLAAAV